MSTLKTLAGSCYHAGEILKDYHYMCRTFSIENPGDGFWLLVLGLS